MFRKFVCVFLIVWLVASPAYAATTSSAFDWQVVPMSLNDGIMTTDVSDASVEVTLGNYSFDNDSFTWHTVYAVDSSPVQENLPETFARFPSSNIYDSANPFFGMRIRLNNLSVNDGRTVNFLINRLCLYMYATSGGEQLISSCMNQATLSPVRAYVSYSWKGSGKYTSSSGSVGFKTVSGTDIVPLDFSFQNSSTSYLSNGGSGLQFSDKPVSDLNFSFTVDLPDTISESGYEYEVVSGSITSAVMYVAFPFSSQNFDVFPDIIFDDSTYFTLRFMSTYAGGQPKYYLSESGTATSSTGSLFASLNQSISSLSSSLSKQITEVKQTVSQGASEVKDAISSQTQTLTDKLSDVKDGIVNGITELKETTEQGFKDVVQGITDLPGKMQEMLTDFIVPDEDTVADKMTDFQSLAEEKLGVIYQVPTMMFDMAEGIISGVSDPEGEMVLPKFEIIMPATNQTRSGETLTVWEEYRFAIWPAGTEVIQTAVQTATSMICVIFTFNALKRKYEEWLDGH